MTVDIPSTDAAPSRAQAGDTLKPLRGVALIVALGCVSFALTLLLPVYSASRYGDLSDWYSDHLHHAFSVWVFVERGFDIYRMSFGEAAQGLATAQDLVSWRDNTMVYPPGIF